MEGSHTATVGVLTHIGQRETEVEEGFTLEGWEVETLLGRVREE